jgi:BTB/POZ domain
MDRSLKHDGFTFLIGPDQERFELHSGLVSRYSAPLNAMMNNKHMKEPLNSRAYLEDVDVNRFLLFVEYIYFGTGMYRV